MIPLRDHNPSGTFPGVTVALILANVLVFFYEASLGPALQSFVAHYALIPAEVTGGFLYGTATFASTAMPLLTSMFLHGGWLHLIGNMWFLWIFGDNVEDTLGFWRYILFYVACGVGAGATHLLVEPASTAPTLGASGAIAGVLGAYAILFPRARIVTLIPVFFYIQLVELPALIVLGMWFVLQLFNGSLALASSVGGGIAWGAHIGGFLVGALLILLLRPRRVSI